MLIDKAMQFAVLQAEIDTTHRAFGVLDSIVASQAQFDAALNTQWLDDAVRLSALDMVGASLSSQLAANDAPMAHVLEGATSGQIFGEFSAMAAENWQGALLGLNLTTSQAVDGALSEMVGIDPFAAIAQLREPVIGAIAGLEEALSAVSGEDASTIVQASFGDIANSVLDEACHQMGEWFGESPGLALEEAMNQVMGSVNATAAFGDVNAIGWLADDSTQAARVTEWLDATLAAPPFDPGLNAVSEAPVANGSSIAGRVKQTEVTKSTNRDSLSKGWHVTAQTAVDFVLTGAALFTSLAGLCVVLAVVYTEQSEQWRDLAQFFFNAGLTCLVAGVGIWATRR